METSNNLQKPITTRDEKFKKIATTRTNKILRLLDILGNCSNKTNYKYTEEQVDKIFNTLENKLSDVRAKFKSKEKPDFQL